MERPPRRRPRRRNHHLRSTVERRRGRHGVPKTLALVRVLADRIAGQSVQGDGTRGRGRHVLQLEELPRGQTVRSDGGWTKRGGPAYDE